MKLCEIYKQNNKLPISFEVFPPKDDVDGLKTEKLINELLVLKKFNPKLISVTYGAGGTNQEKSLDLVKKLQQKGFNVMPHFTCVNATKNFVEDYLKIIKLFKIENILALRGDIPQGMEHKNFEFKYACDLLEFIKQKSDLSVGVAGYPEKHIDCESMEKDILNLKNKVDKGADVIFTQLFFENEKFHKFVDTVNKMGIKIPVIPGIMPLLSFKSIERIVSMSNTKIPEKLYNKMEKYKDDNKAIAEIGIEYSIKQCKDLVKNGVSGLHFYTLNKSYSTDKILENI